MWSQVARCLKVVDARMLESVEPLTGPTEGQPKKVAPDADSREESRSTASGGDETLDVLLIDDEPELRLALEEAVREAGHRVTVCGDGAEGLIQITSKV